MLKNKFQLFAGFIWGLTALTIEFSTKNTDILNLLLILTSSVLLLVNLEYKIKEEHYDFIYLFSFYILVYFVTFFLNDINSFNNILKTLLLIYIVLVLIFLTYNLQHLWSFIYGLALAGIFIILYYILQIDFSTLLNPSYRFSTNMNSNSLSSTCLFLCMTYLYFYLKKINHNKIINLLLITLIILGVLIIIATKSRTSIILIFLAISYIIYLKNKKLLFTFLFILIIYFIYNIDIIFNVLRFENLEGYTGANNITNLSGRTIIWENSLNMLINNYFIGVGPENAIVQYGHEKVHSHNAYIQILLEVGIIGFIPILLILIYIFRNFFRKPYFDYFKIIFLIGFIRTITENKFFNYGTTSSLLFLISIILLSKTYYKGSTNDN